MSTLGGPGRRLEQALAAYFGGPLPEPDGLPRYVAPLPTWLEDVALRLAWPIALVNLVGTLFGFWYYGFQPVPADTPLVTGQFALTPLVMWPVVPDSPVATLFIGLAFALWKLDRTSEVVNALAFFGCLKLGLWTPFVQLWVNGLGDTPLWLYHFLVWSHLAMAVEAFVIYRFSDFPVPAVAAATAWYLLNDVVDYFVPVVGDPHHSLVVAEYSAAAGRYLHDGPAHDQVAAAAVVLTVLSVFLALATRVEKVRARAVRD